MGRNGIKPLHDPGGEALTQQLQAAEAVAKQAKEDLLAAYRRADLAEADAACHQTTKEHLKVRTDSKTHSKTASKTD